VAAIDIVIGGAFVLAVADPMPWVRPAAAELAIAAFVLLGLAPGPSTRLRAVGDVTGLPLDSRRLAMARRLALLAVPAALLVGGEDEVTRLSPVVASLAGLGLANIRRSWQRRAGRLAAST
jgi:hypothetical protein